MSIACESRPRILKIASMFTLLCLQSESTAQIKQPLASISNRLLSAVPMQWKSIAASGCVTIPKNHPIAGVYYSNYVGTSFKLLLLGANADFSLMHWSDRPGKYERKYNSTYRTTPDSVKLDIRLTRESLGSDANDELLIPVTIGNHRHLLLNSSLDEIGASIQWNGRIGRSSEYLRKIDCSEPLPLFDDDGPIAPDRKVLPLELQKYVFEKPVIATIVGLVDSTKTYDRSNRDGEFLVTIDKGAADGFRINMPLCSPKNSGQSWHGWVSSEVEHRKSVFRVNINEPEQGMKLVFPSIGQKLTTRSADCQKN
jgi:hypothetical protein